LGANKQISLAGVCAMATVCKAFICTSTGYCHDSAKRKYEYKR